MLLSFIGSRWWALGWVVASCALLWIRTQGWTPQLFEEWGRESATAMVLVGVAPWWFLRFK
jgi:hypothetical protein